MGREPDVLAKRKPGSETTRPQRLREPLSHAEARGPALPARRVGETLKIRSGDESTVDWYHARGRVRAGPAATRIASPGQFIPGARWE
jgi:hypothetical protein